MICFSNKYLEDQSVINHNYLDRYLDFTDLTEQISRMYYELKSHNELLNRNEAIRIIKMDNAEPLKLFSHGFIKRHISTK